MARGGSGRVLRAWQVECMCIEQGSLAHALPSCDQAQTPRSPVCLMAEDTRPLVLYLSLHGSAELAQLPAILVPATELAGQATRGLRCHRLLLLRQQHGLHIDPASVARPRSAEWC